MLPKLLTIELGHLLQSGWEGYYQHRFTNTIFIKNSTSNKFLHSVLTSPERDVIVKEHPNAKFMFDY